jgi:hypothetical protein
MYEIRHNLICMYVYMYVFHSLIASTYFGLTCRSQLGLKNRIVDMGICWF